MIDFNYQKNGTILNRNVDLVLEQLDLLLNTEKCEVLGDEEYGQDFYKYLYEMNLSNGEIKEYIENTIKKYVDLRGGKLNVSVSLYQGTERDIILVSLTLFLAGNTYNRIFKIA